MKLPKRHRLDGTPLPTYEPRRRNEPRPDKKLTKPTKPPARGAHLP